MLPKPALKDPLQTKLPTEIHFLLCFFFKPRTLITKVQALSRYWHRFVQDPKLWQLINDSVMPLNVLERLRIEYCLAERRSKGKLFATVDRCTG